MNMKRIFIAVFTAFVLCSGSQIHAGNYITEYKVIDATYSSLEIAGSFNIRVILPASAALEKVNVSGASVFSSETTLSGSDFYLGLSGASAIKYKGNAVIDVKVSGSSSVIRN